MTQKPYIERIVGEERYQRWRQIPNYQDRVDMASSLLFFHAVNGTNEFFAGNDWDEILIKRGIGTVLNIATYKYMNRYLDWMRKKLDPKNICVDTKVRLKKEKKGFTKEQLDEVFRGVHPAREGREIPITSLYQRLGIKKYDRKAEFVSYSNKFREVLIPIKYGFGNISNPIISKGMKVQKGDVIASSEENELTVPVHASIAGIVKDVTQNGILISTN